MKATISVEHDEQLLKYFEAEEKTIPRGSFTITSNEEEILFSLEAKDAVALRTLLNTIAKLLIVWEKTL